MTDGMLMSAQTQQYVIVHAPKKRSRRDSIALILQGYPGVKILKESGPGTALVEMSQDAFAHIAQRFPQLIIEPNIRYKHT